MLVMVPVPDRGNTMKIRKLIRVVEQAFGNLIDDKFTITKFFIEGNFGYIEAKDLIYSLDGKLTTKIFTKIYFAVENGEVKFTGAGCYRDNGFGKLPETPEFTTAMLKLVLATIHDLAEGKVSI